MSTRNSAAIMARGHLFSRRQRQHCFGYIADRLPKHSAFRPTPRLRTVFKQPLVVRGAPLDKRATRTTFGAMERGLRAPCGNGLNVRVQLGAPDEPVSKESPFSIAASSGEVDTGGFAIRICDGAELSRAELSRASALCVCVWPQTKSSANFLLSFHSLREYVFRVTQRPKM